MNKMNMKNYWIKTLVIILTIAFANLSHADVKQNASNQVTYFLDIINEFASQNDDKLRKEKSNKILKIIDLEFMSKATLGKYWKKVNDNEKIQFKANLFKKFIGFIDLHVEDFKKIQFKEKNVKIRGPKLVYVNGHIDTKKIKNLNITWKISSKETKILDVEIEKVSLIKSQRLEMRDLLRKNKDNFSNFLKLYFKKNE